MRRRDSLLLGPTRAFCFRGCLPRHSKGRAASAQPAIVGRDGGEAAAEARRLSACTNLIAAIDRIFSREEIEKCAKSAHGRRTMFHEAGVMLEMADYAERNGGAEVAPLVASLRSRALGIRLAMAKSVVFRRDSR